MAIKIRLVELGKKQTDLLKELRKRQYKIQPGELSQILTGLLTTPKADVIKHAVSEILEEWSTESERTGD